MLLKSGKQDEDERAEKELLRELARKPDEIELPSLTDLASEEKFNEDLAVEMRVEFSLIAIDPDDQKEQFFREMLLNTEADLKEFDDPIAIPIYGRGRTYFALVGPGITADNIADNCNFICGACSCEVKRDNPGQDLLLAANWNRVQPGNWVNDTPLPELTGIGDLAMLGGTPPEETGGSPEPEAPRTTQVSIATEPTDNETDASAASSSVASMEATSSPVSEASEAPTPSDSSASSNVVAIVGGWIAGLLLLGVCFHFWQRSRDAE